MDENIPDSIDNLGLKERTWKTLVRGGVTKISQVRGMSDDEVGCLRNMGKKGKEDLRSCLVAHDVFRAADETSATLKVIVAEM